MIVSIIIGVIVLGCLAIYLAFETRNDLLNVAKPPAGKNPDSGVKVATIDPDIVKNKWTEITAMQSSGPSGLKNALIEADKLLDYVMIGKGFVGDTMGDRLKSGGQRFSNLNAIWTAHKLRNQLAHEVEHDLVPEQVKSAVTVLGQGIRELGVEL